MQITVLIPFDEPGGALKWAHHQITLGQPDPLWTGTDFKNVPFGTLQRANIEPQVGNERTDYCEAEQLARAENWGVALQSVQGRQRGAPVPQRFLSDADDLTDLAWCISHLTLLILLSATRYQKASRLSSRCGSLKTISSCRELSASYEQMAVLNVTLALDDPQTEFSERVGKGVAHLVFCVQPPSLLVRLFRPKMRITFYPRDFGCLQLCSLCKLLDRQASKPAHR
ncbi:hypothetical protein [Sinorhizobium chiapasense]|uniref:Uncharacterized protein n=1 Tax=Sinorhizobium chiapasense TaxID=501572 RepID=A0ABZ2BLP7_9HYPH